MSVPSATMPSASVQCLLDDGRLLTVQASCRARDGRADIKCHGPRAIALRVQEILRLARHTEAEPDSRQQVVISLDPWPSGPGREWELALVLADRMVRGVYQPEAAHLFAHGWSDRWQCGAVAGAVDATGSVVARYQALMQAQSGQQSLLVLGGIAENEATPTTTITTAYISHLGALLGHPDPQALVSASRCWFPLFSGGVHDSLNWVEVCVRPLAQDDAHDEGSISVVGLDLQQQHLVQTVLQDARLCERKSARRWRSVVRFGQGGFYGESYQLALVLADRIARGREFPARGRVIATGRSGAWHTGQVDSVDECEAKCALILQQARRGDRVLLPAAWEALLPPQFLTKLAANGVSCACVARLGLL
jgi:hypothetical protein